MGTEDKDGTFATGLGAQGDCVGGGDRVVVPLWSGLGWR